MNALPLFDYAQAIELRDEGMQQASSHSPEFSEIAHDALVRIAKRQLVIHTDDLIAELGSIKPSHPNAFGSVWARAVRERIIQRTNQTRPSADTRKRAHNYPLYLSLIHDPRVAS